MAHLLDIVSGKATFARAEGTQAAWHRLGQIMTPDMTPEERLQCAASDYEVIKVPNMHTCPRSGELITAKDFAMIRKDLNKVSQFDGLKYANVSAQYKPVQPLTVVKFFHDLAQKHDLTIDTIGSLQGGRKIWALAKLGKDFTLAGGDKVAGYVLLSTSYDATMATRIGFTTVRVVCNNTLQMALQDEKKNFFSVPHSTNFDAEKVAIDLGVVSRSFDSFHDVAKELTKVKVTDKQAARWLIDLFESKDANPEKLSTRKSNTINSVYEKFKGRGIGATMASAEGTAWGLVNAVTEYFDHDYGRNEENRFAASQFGVGATAKDQALEYITEVTGIMA